MDIFSPNFIYAIILTRSTSGLLQIIFCSFVTELWSLIYFKISFPLNIFCINKCISTKTGDKNSTCPLVITSEILRRVILPKKDYSRVRRKIIR